VISEMISEVIPQVIPQVILAESGGSRGCGPPVVTLWCLPAMIHLGRGPGGPAPGSLADHQSQSKSTSQHTRPPRPNDPNPFHPLVRSPAGKHGIPHRVRHASPHVYILIS
jgi:hypothetical protein